MVIITTRTDVIMVIVEEFQSTVLPLFLFFIFCNIVGFLGNITVIYIYSLKYPRNHHRLLVLVLSVVDLTACCTTVPVETVSTWHWFDYPSSSLCKARMFFIMFIGLTAMYMLFVTAVFKYRRICRPFAKQVTRNMIATLCVVGVVSGLVYGIPGALLFDVNHHSVVINNETEPAQLCEVSRLYHDTQYPAVYRHCVAFYSLLLIAAVVMYFFVAKTTVTHFRRRKQASKAKEGDTEIESSFWTTSVSDQSVVSQSTSPTSTRDITLNQNGEIQSTSSTLSQSSSVEGVSRTNKSIAVTSGNSALVKSTLSNTQIRSVLIMVIIAGTFSMTFLMGLSFGYVFALRTYGDYSSLGEIVFLFACYRLYFLNYAMNPVVYFVLDKRFRKEVIKTSVSVKCAIAGKCQDILSFLR